MVDAPHDAGPSGSPRPSPDVSPGGVDPQQWWDWWWRTYGYQAYGYQAQGYPADARPTPGRPTPGYPAYGYPAYGYPQDALPPRRRHRVLGAILVVLALMVVIVPAVAFVAQLAVDLDKGQSAAGVNEAEVGPVPSGDRRFTPSAQQRAYFFEIGPMADKGTRVAKWTRPTVRVAIVGGSTVADRQAVKEILATINDTVDEPQFVYSRAGPQIVVSFLSHDEFRATTSRTDDTIGWCESNFTVADHSLHDAQISIDDDPEFRDDREAVLSHEFGHALGLDDTRKAGYAGAIMYFRVSGASHYTRLDLAALRMLYDGRTRSGATQGQLAHAWPKE